MTHDNDFERRTSYWARQALTRRRFLRATASGVAAGGLGVLLVSCGGDDEDGGQATGARTTGAQTTGAQASGSSSGSQGAGRLAQPVDETSSAVRGGIFKSHSPIEQQTMDIVAESSPASTGLVGNWVYEQLLKYKVGRMGPSDGSVEPSLAQSWEVSPDRLKLTLKLRENAKWDERPPTSGRRLDSADVAFAWSRFADVGSRKSDLLNELQPDAPFLGLETPDDQTVVFNLSKPDGLAPTLLASNIHFSVVPPESESQFDMRSEARGTGPWVISEYKPSTSISHRQNANFWGEKPFLEGFDTTFIPDYPAALSQFKAGAIWNDVVVKNDIIRTMQEQPELLLYSTGFDVQFHFLGFGWATDTPFVDERLRQAVSMSIDREIFLDTFDNIKAFEDAGIDLPWRYHSHLSAGWDGFWLDPLAEDFGPNAKYFSFAPDEAKSLVSAAGYPDGLDTVLNLPVPPNYGADFVTRVEVHSQMMADVGIRATVDPIDYPNPFREYIRAPFDFNGIVAGVKSPNPHPALWLLSVYSGNGARTVINDGQDPTLESQLAHARAETDTERQRAMILDLQRDMAKLMWCIPGPGLSAHVFLSHPWIRNQGVYSEWVAGASMEHDVWPKLWLDTSKLPS